MGNAKKGPEKDFNAFKDFTDVELNSQIILCCMVYFKMTSMDGKNKSKEI